MMIDHDSDKLRALLGKEFTEKFKLYSTLTSEHHTEIVKSVARRYLEETGYGEKVGRVYGDALREGLKVGTICGFILGVPVTLLALGIMALIL